VESVPETVREVPSDFPETFRQDPMFGQDVGYAQGVDCGSGYLTQVSTSDGPSDESYQNHQIKVLQFVLIFVTSDGF